MDQFRNEEKDVLNGALSGGIAMNLKDELDYLIPRMKELPGINFETDWKMITIQIGSKYHTKKLKKRCLQYTDFIKQHY